MAIASTFGPCSMTTDIVLDLAAAVIAAVSLPGAPYGSPSTEAGQMAPNRPWMLELAHIGPFRACGGPGRPPTLSTAGATSAAAT